MKVTNIRRKLAAALVAGGMFMPIDAHGAGLDVNLVINGDFENVDYGNIGNYNAPDIQDWGGATVGGAYSHTGFTGTGQPGPTADYANGGLYTTGTPFSGGGDFYFTPGNRGNQSLTNAISQNIDVSTGASGSLITTGNAAFKVSALFNSFGGQTDHGVIDLEFLNSGSTVLSAAQLTPGSVNFTEWTSLSTAGVIPAGTATVRVSAWGVLDAGGSSDGYMDNIDFQVTDELILPALDLRVDRDNGSLILSNNTGSTVNLSGYSITSGFESLNPASWRSVADNYDANSGGAVDGSNIWTELTQAGAHGDLSEGDLASGNGGSLAHQQSINLGNAGTWIRNPNEDLVFEYISGGTVIEGIVNFADAAPFATGDLNTDGAVNASDWTLLRSNQHTDLSAFSLAEAYRRGDLTGDGENNHADFAAFKNAFDASNGSGAFQAMVATAVPEPTSVVLLMTSGLLLLSRPRRGQQ